MIPDEQIKNLWYVTNARSLTVYANKRGISETKIDKGASTHFDTRGVDDGHKESQHGIPWMTNELLYHSL